MLTSGTGEPWFEGNCGLAFMQNNISAAYSVQAVTGVPAMMDGGLGINTDWKSNLWKDNQSLAR